MTPPILSARIQSQFSFLASFFPPSFTSHPTPLRSFIIRHLESGVMTAEVLLCTLCYLYSSSPPILCYLVTTVLGKRRHEIIQSDDRFLYT